MKTIRDYAPLVATMALLIHAAPLLFVFRSFFGVSFLIVLAFSAALSQIVVPFLAGFFSGFDPELWTTFLSRYYSGNSIPGLVMTLLPLIVIQVVFNFGYAMTAYRVPTGSVGHFWFAVPGRFRNLDLVLIPPFAAFLFYRPDVVPDIPNIRTLLPSLISYYLLILAAGRYGIIGWLDDGRTPPQMASVAVRKSDVLVSKPKQVEGLSRIFSRRDPALHRLAATSHNATRSERGESQLRT